MTKTDKNGILVFKQVVRGTDNQGALYSRRSGLAEGQQEGEGVAGHTLRSHASRTNDGQERSHAGMQHTPLGRVFHVFLLFVGCEREEGGGKGLAFLRGV